MYEKSYLLQTQDNKTMKQCRRKLTLNIMHYVVNHWIDELHLSPCFLVFSDEEPQNIEQLITDPLMQLKLDTNLTTHHQNLENLVSCYLKK